MTVPSEARMFFRDASFWRKPSRNGVRKAHFAHPTRRGPFGHSVARCNSRIQLDDTNDIPKEKAGELACKRCRRKRL